MASEYADYIFYGGSIITMEEGKPSVEALAVKVARLDFFRGIPPKFEH